MLRRRALFLLAALFYVAPVFFAAHTSGAQSGRVVPKATPTPEDQIRVFTEEVRIPVFARDDYGHFDPSLEVTDVLVLEDGVPQQVRSIRRIPASVLLVLNTGGELNPGLRTRTTREMALNLVSSLRAGDSVAILQFNRRTELVQPWTTDLEAARHAVTTKLAGGTGARHAEALTQAARLFAEQPVGNRHVVLVTDGVETPGGGATLDDLDHTLSESSVLGGRAGYADAYKRLQAAGVTVHVVSYGTLGRNVAKQKERDAPQAASGVPGSVKASGVARAGIDPTMPPTESRGGAMAGLPGAGSITFDPQMRRVRKAYERAMQRGEQQMKTLAAETGGRIYLPATDEELIAEGADVAREIGTEYVLTYTPKRPLAEAPPDEYRRITAVPRHAGLLLRSRRGYVAAAAVPVEPDKDQAAKPSETKTKN
ncbi:MAG: VWA domain-containing protein [Acidobacteria bacterium]|nr:VWA domain-containing protein [Acidobacteriota bacterium]